MPLAPKGGVARRSSLLGRCLTTPSVFVTQYYRQRLHKEPSSPVAPELPSFMRDETLLGRCLRRRRGGARSITPSASYDPSGSPNLTNSANLGPSITVINTKSTLGTQSKIILLQCGWKWLLPLYEHISAPEPVSVSLPLSAACSSISRLPQAQGCSYLSNKRLPRRGPARSPHLSA